MVGLQAIFLCLPLLAMRWPAIAISPTYYATLLSRVLTQSTLPRLFSADSLSSQTTTVLSEVLSNRLEVGVSVPAIAKQVTVRILGNPGIGSGAIVQHQEQIYTVVTCAHVVAESQDHYIILTADGQAHTGQWLRSIQLPDADKLLNAIHASIKLIEWSAIADYKALAVGDPVYASGFSNWYWTNLNAMEDTRDWGTRAFRLTSGKVAMLPEKSLQAGYQLGYPNEIEQGMSGGPVLNKYGRLIGINGRLKYPSQGIVAFIFADGTVPSEELFQQMEALSWAVPSTTFRQALNSEVRGKKRVNFE